MFELLQLIWIVLVDAALSLDNALLISTVANDVKEEDRDKVKLYGIAGAVIARLVLAFFAGFLLKFTAFTLVGGAYLVWVAWNMWRKHDRKQELGGAGFFGPIAQVIIADVMMSGDNVLAIAHTARGNGWLMVFGIVLSIALMFVATKWISLALEKWPRLFYGACGIVAATGLHMVWAGAFTRV